LDSRLRVRFGICGELKGIAGLRGDL
jgi:hypothetical protein